MKKILVLFSAFGTILLLTRCSAVAIDLHFHKQNTITSTPKKTPAEEIEYAKTHFTDTQRAAGEVIFNRVCGDCHDLPVPEEYKVHELDDVLPKMFRRAKLNYDDAGLVKAYLVANAKGA